MQPPASIKIRESVLGRLGLSAKASALPVDIAAGHAAHIERQKNSGTYRIENLIVMAPAGIYQPAPGSSSAFFIAALKTMRFDKDNRLLEIGAGSGVISLFLAQHFQSVVVATDLSSKAVAAVRRNADTNKVTLDIRQSDLFTHISENNFDLILFNNPLIDQAFDCSIEQQSLSDPMGGILRSYLTASKNHIGKDGEIWFGICSNTAYEVLHDFSFRYEIKAFEIFPDGFWRSIVSATI